MMKRQAGVADGKSATESSIAGSVEDVSKDHDPVLDQAESYLDSGDYSKALDSVTRAIADAGTGDDMFYNRALGILVHVMAHLDTPQNHGQNAMACFDGLGPSFPDHGPAAQCWLAVLDELLVLKSQLKGLKARTQAQKSRIKTLESQLEQLKAVDLELGTPETEGDHHAP